jgi:hypothetical protein
VAHLDTYIDAVLEEQDKVLLCEASACLRAGARRAAYITIWLATAEALRRKFVEAQRFDGDAGKIVGEIEQLEAKHTAIDGLLIDRAAAYGFVSDAEKQRLRHLYENRNVYGHPYEESPSEEAIIAAASDAVEIVLGRPTRLRHGYLKRQVERLTSDTTFLADHQPAVQAFADQVCQRSAKNLRPWFIRKLLDALDPLFADPSQDLLRRRGVWILWRILLTDLSIFDAWDPADDLPNHRRVLPGILAAPQLFGAISPHAQDIVVNVLCQDAAADGHSLELLWLLKQDVAFTPRHHSQFAALLDAMPVTQLTGRGLPLVAYWSKVVDGLASHSWGPQNEATDVLRLAGPSQAADLDAAAQEVLGRNVMQAAEGTAWGAVRFLNGLADTEPPWPATLVEGAAVEPFLAENGQVRLKPGQMESAVRSLRSLVLARRNAVIDRIRDGIAGGTVRDPFLFSHQRPTVLDTLAVLVTDPELVRVSEIADAIAHKEVSEAAI